MSETAPEEGRAEALGLFLGSVAILALEVTQVRIFSYALDPLLVFSAISVALLGMGAGGILVALRPSLAEGDVRPRMARCLLGFSLSVLLAHALFARFSERVGFGAGSGVFWSALALFSVMTIPYAFGGALVSIAMTRHVRAVGRMYFANLVGSALGCAMVYPLLRPLGAEALVCLVAVLAAGTAATLSRGRLRLIAAVFVALAIATVFFAARLLPFRPDPRDLYGVARGVLRKMDANAPEPTREVSRWDPLARVEVHAFPGVLGMVNGVAPVRLFTQDGGAGSMLIDVRDHPMVARAMFEGTVYGGVYALRPIPEQTLVIGLGGAPDVLTAIHHRAKNVVGVEVNRTTIEVVGRDYAAMLGAPYARPGVTIVERDGRNFVHTTRDRYDVIQMTGADTYAAGSGGAFMFSESYLYTVEAFEQYLRCLKDDGVLSVIRFGLEPLRVVTTELAALRRLGVPHPEKHFLIVRQGIWVNVLLSRRELRAEEIASFYQALSRGNALERLHIPVYDALGFGLSGPMELLYAPGRPSEGAFGALLTAAAVGAEQDVLRTLDLDFSPVTDDRPFFFQFVAARQLPKVLSSGDDDYYARGLRAHLSFLAAVVVIAVASILAPVWARRRQPSSGGLAPALLYFGALGIGYLFVELTLMQRCALYLGHPTWSVVTTLLTLLLGSGVGARASGRSSRSPADLATRAGLAIAVASIAAQFALRPLFELTAPAPLGLKMVVVALVTFGLGFLMGAPFPMGLRMVGERAKPLVAIGLGVNGFASVFASLVAVPIAMFAGFSTVTFVAAGLYLLAALVAKKLA